ncbi:MAG: hypothetical protein ACJA07_003161 [Rhodococcus sp. (in: high G+C Gram-positive bacteria)]
MRDVPGVHDQVEAAERTDRRRQVGASEVPVVFEVRALRVVEDVLDLVTNESPCR